ncbi:MAG: flagellar biosynthetic protein FliO [Alphaproteobacteria bacterium]|nr:flagellar biosynthetic protein FliO [Alphaproteobacteria bacterium]
MDAPDYLRFFLALVCVLAMMGLLGYAMRRFNVGGAGLPLSSRRLNILETRAIDHKHKLVLVKCDTREHLLLLGPQGQTVVETNIPAKENA